jgi:D-beta-D-heptose 7-phosphate kinase/D-beta-D-heptose 1-phosphate adenosyltransferase
MITKHKKIVVAVSGGFDPVHVGHIELFQRAKELGDELVVILNNDNWLRKKKGYSFMPEKERMKVIKSLKMVDRVVMTAHPKNPKDMSVSKELQKIRPDFFVNAGDRTRENVPEVAICEKIGCEMVFGLGPKGKVQSSSWLLQNFLKVSGARNADGNPLKLEKLP